MPVVIERMQNDAGWPLVVQCTGRGSLCEWLSTRKRELDDLLAEHGALLFRGFHIDSEGTFGEAARCVAPDLLDYTYRSTPRTTVERGIYTATEYPATVTIPQHNENAYQRDWPMRLMFACVQPAASGGDTPLADTRRVTRRLGGQIVDTFAEKGVLYVRNYHKHLDVQWQTVFQTELRAQAEEFCRRNDIDYEWIQDGRLRTKQRCQGVAAHPQGETLFFNQAHLFHVSSLDAATRNALLSMFTEADLPRNAYYGDGTALEQPTLESIRAAYHAEATSFTWQRGDFLLIDNMLVSHGRMPYQGTRKVLVSMALPRSSLTAPASGTGTSVSR